MAGVDKLLSVCNFFKSAFLPIFGNVIVGTPGIGCPGQNPEGQDPLTAHSVFSRTSIHTPEPAAFFERLF